MIRLLLFTLPFFFTLEIKTQESGEISGHIRTEDGAASFATIELLNTTIGVSANEKGFFRLQNVPPGEQTISNRFVGYQAAKHKVNNKANEKKHIEISLRKDNLNLEEVVISASRYEMKSKESPIIVQTMDSKLFNATQSMVLSESLNYQSGVRVENNCQNCGFTQVRLNGLEGAYSQILFNSRPVFSALNSVYGLDQIPTNIIDRVEVVRSGGSALYGSNAIGGTINIITKEPVYNNWAIGTNFSVIDGRALDQTTNFNASIVDEEQKSGVTFFGMHRGKEAYDANKDGFTELPKMENNTLGAKAYYKINKRSQINLDFNTIKEFRRGGDRLDLAPHFTDITEQLDHSVLIGGLEYEWQSKDEMTNFSAYWSAQKTDRISYYGGLGGERSPADSSSAANAYGQTDNLSMVSGLQLSKTINSENTVTLGAEYQSSQVDDQITGYNRLIDQQVWNFGSYLQEEWKPNSLLTFLIGLRYDFNLVNGDYQIGSVNRSSDIENGIFSPRLTLIYKLNEHLSLRGGYARGFRAPQAFNEDMHISSVGGEPLFVTLSENLKTEFSDAFTSSLEFEKAFGRLQTNVLVEGFYTDLDNSFTQVSLGAVLSNGSILEEVRNGVGSKVWGSNFQLRLSPGQKFYVELGGTIQQTRYKNAQLLFESDEQASIKTNRYLRAPNNYGYFTVNSTIRKKLKLDFSGTYTGSMIIPKVTNELGSLELRESPEFYELNIKLSRQVELSRAFQLELSAGVQNILNSYQDDFDLGAKRDSDYIYGPARPRTFFIGVKLGSLY